MPKEMFRLQVCPVQRSTNRWYTLPLSLVLHVVLLAAAIVVPLVATDALPIPRSMLAFMITGAPPSVPPPAPPSAAARKQIVQEASLMAAPIEAPSGIAPEPLIDVEFDHGIHSDSVDGMPDGVVFGPAADTIDAPPPAPVPQQPVRPGGQIKAPSRIKYVPPVYPAIAQSVHIQGDVIIEAVIAPDGKVREVHLLRSIPLLDLAALDAVQAWEYTPTLLNGQPVAVIMTVTVRFRLH